MNKYLRNCEYCVGSPLVLNLYRRIGFTYNYNIYDSCKQKQKANVNKMQWLQNKWEGESVDLKEQRERLKEISRLKKIVKKNK